MSVLNKALIVAPSVLMIAVAGICGFSAFATDNASISTLLSDPTELYTLMRGESKSGALQ
jgi:hypothetical protein